MVRGLARHWEHPPDLVAFPRHEADVTAVLDWAGSEDIVVVPYGGGSSVVGGVEAPAGDRPVVSLDLAGLSGVAEVDRTSRAARIGAGTLGPDLEAALRPGGLTLRHYPQSFEFSTLGGWLATRAGGHFATLHTHIDDFVESIRAVTPVGVWESRRLPGSGAGPSPDRLLLGSEGTLGVITEAWMRLQDRPVHRASFVARFADFGAGARAARDLAQSGLWPQNCRLVDATEAWLTGAGDGTAPLLLVAFESARVPVADRVPPALDIVRSAGGTVDPGAADAARAEGHRQDDPVRTPRDGGARRSSGPRTSATAWSGWAWSTRRSRAPSPGTGSTTSSTASGGRSPTPWPTPGAAPTPWSRAVSPTSTPTVPPRTSPSSPRGGPVSGGWPSGTRSRPRRWTPWTGSGGRSPTTTPWAGTTAPATTVSDPTCSPGRSGRRRGPWTPPGC